MAALNPVSVTDPMGGETYTFWTDGTSVLFTTNLRASPITAFSQPVADSPIDVSIDATGLLTVTYLDGSGNRLSKTSPRDGDSGSWA